MRVAVSMIITGVALIVAGVIEHGIVSRDYESCASGETEFAFGVPAQNCSAYHNLVVGGWVAIVVGAVFIPVAIVVLGVLGARTSQPQVRIRTTAAKQSEQPPRWIAPDTVVAHVKSTPTGLWPTHVEYVGLLTAPHESFVYAHLQQARPRVRDCYGNPAGVSGQSAMVFSVDLPYGRPRAIRCMLRAQPGSRERYQALEAIRRGLSSSSSRGLPGCLTETIWLDSAALVRGAAWPVIDMELVEGLDLDVAVEKRLGTPSALRELGQRLSQALIELQGSGIAHGDLQHGNILVEPDGSVRLVDYDGIWLSGIDGPAGEFGHPNYRHPGRAVRHWGPSMDAFSAALLWLSLYAIAADPGLWERFHLEGENLILVEQDLSMPHRTDVWRQLYASPDDEVVLAADNLARLCYSADPPSIVLSDILDVPWHASGRPSWPDPLPPLRSTP
jgi:hypothetical protein